MKLKFFRFIAVLLLAVPGILACYGFLEMKNALFNYFSAFGDENAAVKLQWFKLILGFVWFSIGIAFIGGWIFFRDRKRNYVAPRFKEKKK
jgi:hypothetical protein